MLLTIRPNSSCIEWPILESSDSDSFFVPPNCEVIRKFEIDSINTDHAVIDSQEISPGIYTARTIVNTNMPLVKILNTTNSYKKIPKKLKSTSLENFDIVKFDTTQLNSDRNKALRTIIERKDQGNLPSDLYRLCEEFSDIFILENDKLTTNNFYSQKLNLTDNNPVYIKNYRMPISHKEEIDKQVNSLLRNDLIEPSASNYNSPVIIVPKKSLNGEKKYRMCIDYRQVNKKLTADKYPLPRIDEIIDSLGRAKYFSVIDLFSGFHQIPIHPNSRDITSFSTPKGSFKWKVLPFGLNISPNSFTRMMNIAFTGLTPEKCFIYMDDIIVIGLSVKHHLQNLRSIFEACKKGNLKINPEKCQFFKHEVSYLGHRCTDHGVLPDPEKLSTVTHYPVPKDKDATRRFVAFANYYRKFIKNFSVIAKPLNNLTKKKTNFFWDKHCQNSFEILKSCLLKPPILAYPDFTQEFVITVDASANGIGAVLSQNINGMDKPIAFASKSFNHAESKRAPIEQELTAIYWSVKYFKPYVYDTHFVVRSDHKPLVYLYSLKDPTSRLTRMRLELEEFNFTIEYIKGKDNVCADALSRISFKDIIENTIKETPEVNIFAITRSMSKIKPNKTKYPEINVIESPKVIEAINHKEYKKVPIISLQIRENSTGQNTKQHQKVMQFRAITKVFSHNKVRLLTSFSLEFHDLDHYIKEWLKCLQEEAMKLEINRLILENENELFEHININEFKDLGNKILNRLIIIIKETPITIVDEEKKLEIMAKYHDNPILGGHIGRNRLFFKIKSRYTWKNMSRDIKNFVNKCHECQTNKAKVRNIEPLQITDTPTTSTEKIIIDTIGPLPKSDNGNLYALTIIDDLTKYLVMIPILNKEAKTVAKALFDNFILTFGPMKILVSDRGTEYVNKVSQELLSLFQITHKTSTPYRHQTVGSIERSHRVFNEYLRTYLKTINDWETNMKYFTFCYNTTPHHAYNLQYTPFELTFGKKPSCIEFLNSNEIDPIYDTENVVKEIKYRLQNAQKLAAKLIDKYKNELKLSYDKKSRPITLKVDDRVVLVIGNRNKLEPLYKGPYIVTNILNNNIEIKDINSDEIKLVHKDNVRKYIS